MAIRVSRVQLLIVLLLNRTDDCFAVVANKVDKIEEQQTTEKYSLGLAVAYELSLHAVACELSLTLLSNFSLVLDK